MNFYNLNPNQITELQNYLEKIKNEKLATERKMMNPGPTTNRATDVFDPVRREVPVDWRNFSERQPYQNFNVQPGSRGSTCTRMGKKSDRHSLEDEQKNAMFNVHNGSNQRQLFDGSQKNYSNPYEYGAKQNSLDPYFQSPLLGSYNNNPELISQMGIGSNLVPSSHIRNIDIESALLQKENTHLPGQKQLFNREVDRFERLPFDPQNHRHIVWSDNMPRGGYPTRNERLEL